ncbi:MAG: hypothetical protein ACRCVG_01720 [Methanobacteriaceae archaeon]
MNPKIYLFIICAVLLFVSIGSVFATENSSGSNSVAVTNFSKIIYDINDNVSVSNKSNSSNNSSSNINNTNNKTGTNISSKQISIPLSKIISVSLSSYAVKTGKIITVKVKTKGYVKSVSLKVNRMAVSSKISISKSYFKTNIIKKLKKSSYGYWYYKFSTKGLTTGKYSVKIIVSDGSKSYSKLTNFDVDNVPPKIKYANAGPNTITAGTPFTLVAVTDSSTRKVIAKFKSKSITLNRVNSTHWSTKTTLSYRYIRKLTITVYAYDVAGNVAKKNTYIIANPRYVYWDGTLLTYTNYKVYYNSPKNAYEKAMNELKVYANVYEGRSPENDWKSTLGITYKSTQGKIVLYKVIISYKDPFVVYHEMAHVLNWGWSEYTCDEYAYNRTGYWIK